MRYLVAARSDGSGPRLLRALARRGHAVAYFTSGWAAMGALDAHDERDVAIVEIGEPHLGHLDCAFALARSDVPVILIADDVAWTASGGVADLPANDAELVATIERLAGRLRNQRAHVLVVEDDDDTRASLAEVIACEGLEVIEASNGIEALQRLEAGPLPGLILLDVMMPKMDGLTLLRELRARAAFADVPVVLASCLPIGETPADVPRLTKPLARQPVIDAVRRYLVRRSDPPGV